MANPSRSFLPSPMNSRTENRANRLFRSTSFTSRFWKVMKPRHLRPLLIIALLGVASLNSKFIGAVAQQSSPVALGNETALGISLYKKGDTKAAIGTLRAAVKKQKDDADAWFYLGLAYNKIDEVGSARKAFEAAVKIRPDFAAAHTALGYTWVLENKLGKAITEIDRAL